MLSMSINEYLEKLASTASTPSGGSTVGVISSLGVSLALMASNVSVESKKNSTITSENKPYVEGLIDKLNKSVERFNYLTNADASVFDAYMKASKDDKKDKMMDCLTVPLSVARECIKCIDIMVELSPFITKSIVSDMMIGFIMLRACFEASIINVRINERWINDSEVTEMVNLFVSTNLRRVNTIVEEQVNVLGGRM